MKANAPEKIYLATTKEVQNLDHSFVGIAHSDPQDIVEPIEYVRTDAFIEKVEEYLQEHLIDYWSQIVTNESNFVEGFQKYMKGE